jgi:hypothetical protein
MLVQVNRTNERPGHDYRRRQYRAAGDRPQALLVSTLVPRILYERANACMRTNNDAFAWRASEYLGNK